MVTEEAVASLPRTGTRTVRIASGFHWGRNGPLPGREPEDALETILFKDSPQGFGNCSNSLTPQTTGSKAKSPEKSSV